MEITAHLEVNFEQQKLIDLHSVMNILNLLALEFSMSDRVLGGFSPAKEAASEIYRMGACLRNDECILAESEAKVHEFVGKLREAAGLVLDIARHRYTENDQDGITLHGSVANIESVLAVLLVRVSEIVARKDDPYEWVEHQVEDLKYDLRFFFDALERNSAGAFRIVDDSAIQGQNDYLIIVQIQGDKDGRIKIPAMFQDVIRDLVANSRKYTPVGGQVYVQLYSDQGMVHLSVRDNGIGIPENEIQRLVQFGERGSNIEGKKTFGGGFGLTKAYYVTLRCKGKMWIDSSVGRGTEIRIELPL